MKSLIKIIAGVAIAVISCSTIKAQNILAGWDVSGLTSSGPSPFAATASDPNVAVGGLTRGSGIVSTTTGNVWGGNNWTNAGVAASETQAINGGKYVTFSLTPNSGYSISVTNISKFYVSKSATGPASGELQYSTDGTTFTDITPLTNGVQGTAISAVSIGTFNLSSVAGLQNIPSGTTVIFRIVNWGGTSTGGTWYIGNGNSSGSDLEIQGTVVQQATGTPPAVASLSPSSISTNAGSTVSYTVTSTGDAPSYYWYQQTDTSSNLVSTTGPTLTLDNVTGGNAGSYFIVLSNALGTAVGGPVLLTVADPIIISQPGSAQGLLDGQLQFSVAAAGTSLTYQWYQFDGNTTYSLLNNGTQSSGSVVLGADTSSLSVSNLQLVDATNLAVIVTGTYGSITSSIVAFTVNTSGQLAFWDFNGTDFNSNNPAPYIGAGTATLINVKASSPAVDPIDGAGFTTHLPNSSWATTGYPANGTLNKQYGVQFNVSTVGAKNITLSYDSRVSATASDYERLQFTTNGTDWVDYPTSTTFGGLATTFYPFSYDFTGFPGVANNPNFGVRVVAEFQSTATYGISANANYLGTANTYGTGGTVTYDIVNFEGDAITNNNTPPTISSFADATTPDYQPITLNFTVGDVETPASALTVSAEALSPTTVNPSFTFGGSGANRTLTITPNTIPDQVDAGPILVTVTDGNGDSTVTWFNLTLTSVNLAPTNSLVTLVTTNTIVNTPIIIPFTVSDDRTPVSGLTYSVSSANNTLVPSANVVVNGQGTANPTVTITPASNQVGVASLSITVNDNDTLEPRSTTATFALMIRPNTNIVAIDYFNYDNSGALDTVSAGYWQHLSGVFGQLQVSGGIATVDTFDDTENLQAKLLGAPYNTNSGAVLYSSFIVNLQDPTKLPISSGTYFALFNDGSGVTGPYEGRVIATTNGAALGSYRLGINNFGASATSGQIFPQDLVPGSNYVVVTSLVLSNGFSTIWINPNSESSSNVTDTTPATTNLYNISAFELRQSGGSGGSVGLSKLKVGTTFDSVFPSLFVQPVGTNIIVNWSDPTIGIQSATNVAGPYLDITGATPPYTNTASTNNALFFRFGQ